MYVAADPNTPLLATLPLAGVALTILAGLVGAWIQSRREQSKWLREQRLEAFSKALTLVQEVERFRNQIRDFQTADDATRGELLRAKEELDKLGDQHDALAKKLFEHSAPLTILGPDSVGETLNLYSAQQPSSEDESVVAALIHNRLIREMRSALGIQQHK